jgi:uncharacterized membrane protein YdjX (TVP38/TMEM64 family)
MKKKAALLLLLAVAALFFWMSDARQYLTFESLKRDRMLLRQLVDSHYLLSAFLFVLFFISTAFFVPGAIVATVAGGFLFGTVMGAVYVNIGSVTGAGLAFLSSRYLLGQRIQQKYSDQLRQFNREIDRYGPNYLFLLRIVPVLPFFVVNYLSGLTRISLKRFLITTSLSMLPGSFVYAFAGQQLSQIEKPGDILSAELLIAFGLLALLALLPLAIRLLRRIGSGER